MLFSSVHASIIGVTETAGPSNLDTHAEVIGTPAHVLDDTAQNTGMQGFNEAQGVLTTVAHGIDGGGTIAVGSYVNSHMIFMNSGGDTSILHSDVQWTFDGVILGVMSDIGGVLEAASTFELGNPLTNYTVPFSGSGLAAPFHVRGMEATDSYMVDGNTLTVNMRVTEPGDWISSCHCRTRYRYCGI